MLISHQFLYLGVCLLAVIQTVVCLNLTNSPLIIPPSPHSDHQVYPPIDQSTGSFISNNNNNNNNQNHLEYDPNLFELVEEESLNSAFSPQENQVIASNDEANFGEEEIIGERTAPDTSATVWSRFSGNVVRLFSPARLSSRLNQG